MPVVSNPRDLDPRFAGFGIRAMGERFAPELSGEKNSGKTRQSGNQAAEFTWSFEAILDVNHPLEVRGVVRFCCENDGCTPAYPACFQKSEEAYGLYLPAALPHIGILMSCM